jgi:DNA repair exonuclease SbcCD ATPase subunit
MDSRKSELDKIGNLLKGAFNGRYSSKLGEYKPLPESPPVSNRDLILKSINFENIAKMPIQQTQVKQTEFPNMENYWGQNTVSFISTLVADREKFRTENERVMKLLADKTLNDGGQTQKLASLTAELDKFKDFEKKFVAEQKTVAQQVEQIKVLTSTNATMNVELDQKLKDLDKYKTDLQKSQRDFENNAQLLVQCKTDLDELIQMNKNLETNLNKLKTVESDNALLSKTKVDNEKKIKDLEEDLRNMEEASTEEITAMENEHKTNEKKIQIVLGAQMELMKKQYAENSNSSNAQLLSQIEEVKQRHEEEKTVLNKSIAECETAKQNLEITIAANKKTIDDNNAKISEITDNIALLKSENETLTSSLTEQTNENDKLKQSVIDQKNDCEMQKNKMLEMEAEMNLLNNVNESLKKVNAKMVETISLSEQLTAIKTNDNAILKQRYESSTTEIEKLKNERVDISATVEQQKLEIEEARLKDEAMQAKFEITNCLIDNSIESLTWNGWNDAKSYFVDKYGGNSTDTNIEQFKPQIAQVAKSTNLNEIIGVFGLLKTAFSTSSSSSSSSSIEPTCMKNLVDIIIKFLQAEDAHDTLQKRYDSVPNDESGNKITQNYLEKKQAELQSLFDEHKTLSKKCEDLEGRIASTEGENIDLNKEKRELNAEIERLNQRLLEKLDNLDAEAKKQMEELLEANQQLKLANADLTTEKQESNRTIAQMTAELVQIKSALDASQTTVAKHLETIAEINKENEQLTASVAAHLANIRLLQDELATKVLENAGLTQNDIDNKSEIAKLAQKVADALEENRELETKLQTAIDADEVIIDGMNLQNAAIVEENAKLNKDITDLKQAKEDELAAKERDIAAKESEIEAKERDIREKERNIAALTTELEETKIKIATKEGNLDTTEDNLAAKEQELLKIKQDLETDRRKLGEKERELAKMTQDLAAIRVNLAEKERELTENKANLAKTQASLATKTDNLTQLQKSHEQLRESFVKLQETNVTQQAEHARAIQEAKTKYDNAIRDAQAQVQLRAELEQLKENLEAILQLELGKDEIIAKLQEKLSAIYKQQIIAKANMDLARFKYVKPIVAAPSTTSLSDKNRTGVKKLLEMFGGAGITMKGGTIIHFAYDDVNDLLQNINIDDIQILTNDEIQKIQTNIQTLKDEIAALKSKPVTSSPNLKLLIQKLLITKAAHAQNYKDLLFEKIANGVNKQIIGVQMPAIEKLKTANEDLDAVNKVLNEEREDLETKCADLETANEDLKTKNSKLEKDLVDAKNTATVSSGSTAAITAAKTSLGSGSGSGSSSSSGMYKDKNVIYYKTSPPIATA